MWPAAFKKLAHSNLLHTNGISCWLLQLFASCMNWEPLSKLNEPTQSAAESMKRQTLAQNNGFPALPLGFFFFHLQPGFYHGVWILLWVDMAPLILYKLITHSTVEILAYVHMQWTPPLHKHEMSILAESWRKFCQLARLPHVNTMGALIAPAHH